MKQCSYCGAEYPDDAMECVTDKTPLGAANVERSKIKFGVFSEHKIPLSLTIVSYLFFLPGAVCFGFVAFLIIMFGFSGDFFSGSMIVLCLAGVFFLCLSRGLRQGSRGWRTCALVLIWWGFIGMAYNIVCYLQAPLPSRHEAPMLFWIERALAVIVQIWQYRVLTRPDIRDFFGL